MRRTTHTHNLEANYPPQEPSSTRAPNGIIEGGDPKFKPSNLPTFTADGNIFNFVKLFELAMYNATDAAKIRTILNQIPQESRDILLPELEDKEWTYELIKTALLEEYGSDEYFRTQKEEFMRIGFKDKETVALFNQRFYRSAQVLKGAKKISNLDAKIALVQAITPYQKLHIALATTLARTPTVKEMHEALSAVSNIFKAPMMEKTRSGPFNTPAARVVNPDPKKEEKVEETRICYNCKEPGHLSMNCPKPKKKRQGAIHWAQEEFSEGNISEEDYCYDSGKEQAEL